MYNKNKDHTTVLCLIIWLPIRSTQPPKFDSYRTGEDSSSCTLKFFFVSARSILGSTSFFILNNFNCQHLHCFHLVPGNVSDVTHNVMILGDETLIEIIFQVSWFAPHHAWLNTCEIVTVCTWYFFFCSSTYICNNFPWIVDQNVWTTKLCCYCCCCYCMSSFN